MVATQARQLAENSDMEQRLVCEIADLGRQVKELTQLVADLLKSYASSTMVQVESSSLSTAMLEVLEKDQGDLEKNRRL